MQEFGEEHLVERLRRGESAAFEQMMKTHHPQVYGLAFRLTGSSEAAESLTQDVFVQAFTSIKGFSGRSRLMTWLHTIAVRKAIDAKRARDRRPAFSLSDERVAGRNLPANTPDPSDTAHRNEMNGLLVAAMQKLPDDERAALSLIAFESMPYREAADVLGCPQGTVAWRVWNARRMLRDMLAGPLQMTRKSE